MDRATSSRRAETAFGVKISDGDGGEFLHQFVHAQVAMFSELAELGVLEHIKKQAERSPKESI